MVLVLKEMVFRFLVLLPNAASDAFRSNSAECDLILDNNAQVKRASISTGSEKIKPGIKVLTTSPFEFDLDLYSIYL